MDERLKDCIEIAKDLFEIAVLILTALNLLKKNPLRKTSPQAKGGGNNLRPPLRGQSYYITSTSKMEVKKLKAIVIMLVIINLLDCDFQNLTVLNIIKLVLMLLCLILCLVKGKKQ